MLDTIASIYAMQGVDPEVIVVDDGSTDGSPVAVEEEYDEVRVHKEEKNTKQVNRLRNKGFSLATTSKIFLTDNDVTFDSRCAQEMLAVMESDDSIGVCIPRLMYLNNKSRIYTEGGKVHYVGTSVAPTRDLPATRRKKEPEVAVGGGIALFDANKLERVGGFDEDYELAWGDDGELHQRFLLSGYKCIYVPSAVGYHEHKPFDETRHYRARGQLSNRWRYMLTHYEVRTLVLIAPALALFEFVQLTFYTIKGFPGLYVKGTWDAVRQLPETLERRRDIQALRETPDKNVLFAGPLYVRPSRGVVGTITSVAVNLLSQALSAYWRLIRPLLSSAENQDEQGIRSEK